MFLTSQSTEKLDAALAKVQGELKPAVKDSDNPFFKSKYADLAAVWDSARAALSKHGVSVTQWPLHSTDNRLAIVTRVAHQGEWLCATFSIPVTKQDAQGYGSAVTYARRFALMAALGIAPEDDDGNAAVQKPVTHAAVAKTVQTELAKAAVATNIPQKVVVAKPAPVKPITLTYDDSKLKPEVKPWPTDKFKGTVHPEPQAPDWASSDIPF